MYFVEQHGERSLLIMILSPILFLEPEIYLRKIKRLWTDEIIIKRAWRGFVSVFLEEWQDLILVVCCGTAYNPCPQTHQIGAPVHRDAFSKCRLPCHTRRGHFQSWQHYYESKPSYSVHNARAGRQLYVDDGEHSKHSDWSCLDASKSSCTQRRLGRRGE